MNLNNLPTWLINQHAELQAAQVPLALAQFREHHWQAFLAIGLPTSFTDERWKYADISFLQDAFVTAEPEPNTHDDLHTVIAEYTAQHPDAALLVMVNGRYESSLSNVEQLLPQIKVCSWHDAFSEYANFVNQNHHDHAFAHLNAALATDGLFIQIPDYVQLQTPLLLLSLTTRDYVFHPAHAVLLGEHAALTLIEHYQSLISHRYFINTVTHIALADGASLQHYKLQHENPEAYHIAHTFIRQDEDSAAACHRFAFGGHFARDELAIYLRGRRANAKATGLYVLKQKQQYIDHQVNIQHHAPLTTSDMFYKGIVQSEARAVFNGRLYVEKDAQKIKAYQGNHNLLLSDRAEVYAKPELEIYADDVQCKHGATTGQLDADALFYLRSRGISQQEAVLMLLQGFVDEILQRIPLPTIKHFLQQMVLCYEH